MRHSGIKLSKISGETPDNCPIPECSFARVSRKARAFSFSQNQRSIAWQAFPEGAWFSHEGSMNSAGVLASKYGADVSHTQVGLYGEMGHDVREKTGEGSRLDLVRGGIQQKRADLAQAWLCVPGAVHSGGRFPRGSTPHATVNPPNRRPARHGFIFSRGSFSGQCRTIRFKKGACDLASFRASCMASFRASCMLSGSMP